MNELVAISWPMKVVGGGDGREESEEAGLRAKGNRVVRVGGV